MLGKGNQATVDLVMFKDEMLLADKKMVRWIV